MATRGNRRQAPTAMAPQDDPAHGARRTRKHRPPAQRADPQTAMRDSAPARRVASVRVRFVSDHADQLRLTPTMPRVANGLLPRVRMTLTISAHPAREFASWGEPGVGRTAKGAILCGAPTSPADTV